MATTVPNNAFDTQPPKPLYSGLSKTSSAQDIASAYGQFAGGAGGDTQGNRDTAINYLKGLGIDQSTMDTAYGIYKKPPASGSTSTSTSSSGIVANAMPSQPAATPATYTPTQRTVDRPTETAQGQIESILSKDSPLMQRARALAKQGMAQRGLVNSSMSQGAGVAAMIDRATPIAAQDAQTFSQTAQANMDAANQAGQFNTGETNRFGLQRNDQTFTASENATQRNFTAAQNQLDRDQQIAITKLNNDLNNASVSKTFASNLALATSSTVNAIATDPNLDPDSKRGAIQNAVDNAHSTMQWGSTFYNTPLPTLATPGQVAGVVSPGAGAGAGSGSTQLSVNDLYRQYAGRDADPGGAEYWQAQFGPTIDPSEAARFQQAVAEARAAGRER